MIDHFGPVPGWESRQSTKTGWAVPGNIVPLAGPSKGVIYYSDAAGRGMEPLIDTVAGHLLRSSDPLPISAVTLGPAPVSLIAANGRLTLDVWEEKRGHLTMFKQILAALEKSTADIVYFCEHDVLYPPDHFAFTPPDPQVFYYNQHVWKVDTMTGRALHYRASQTSGLCAYRSVLLAHYRERVALVEAEGAYRMNMGFEPGTRQRRHGGIDDRSSATWMSKRPLVDLRHGKNLTPSRWRQDQFRNQKFCAGWTEAETVPGWGTPSGRPAEWLQEVAAMT
jgi:hypothetical protein